MDLVIKFLASVNQGVSLDREKVLVNNSALVFDFVQLMYKEGLICSCKRKGRQLEIFLKRYKGLSVIKEIKLVSRPGRVVFCSVEQLKLLKGVGLYIVSTVEGIMTHQQAIIRGLGGKVFFFIII